LIAGDGLLTGLTGVVCLFDTAGLKNMIGLCVVPAKKDKRGFSMHGKLWKVAETATPNLLHSATHQISLSH
jgi:hypothetical protein